MLSIALPTAFQQCGVTAMYLFLQAFINPFGNQIASGYVAMSRVMSIARQCLVAFSMTASIYSARYLASKDYDSLKEALFFILKITTIYDILVGIIFIFFNKPICSLFFDITANIEAFRFFKTYLICSVFVMFTSGYKFIFEGILRSALKMKQFMISTVFDMGSRIVVTYLLLSIVNDHAFWMGETIARTSGCILAFIFLFSYFKQNNILKKHS
jgi:Na+-driven multidrug efflux pump